MPYLHRPKPPVVVHLFRQKLPQERIKSVELRCKYLQPSKAPDHGHFDMRAAVSGTRETHVNVAVSLLLDDNMCQLYGSLVFTCIGRGVNTSLSTLAQRTTQLQHTVTRTLASMKPSAISIFSQMRTRSGTMTVIGRKSAFSPALVRRRGICHVHEATVLGFDAAVVTFPNDMSTTSGCSAPATQDEEPGKLVHRITVSRAGLAFRELGTTQVPRVHRDVCSARGVEADLITLDDDASSLRFHSIAHSLELREN